MGAGEDDVAEAAAVLSRRLDEIEAMPGGDARTAAIRCLAGRIGPLWGRATAIRKGEMIRLRDAEQLSLAQLAERVGMSKARAGQIEKARQKERP